MNILDPFFLSINYEVFLPKILSYIKDYLNCEQVFVSQFDADGEIKEIVDFHGIVISNLSKNDRENYQIYQPIISYLNEQKNNYYTHKDKLIFDEDTLPLKRAELAFPITIKTPEIIKIVAGKLWGILFIYDYNYLRVWTKNDIKHIQNIVDQLVISIERNILYKKLMFLQEELSNCQILDEVTGLAKYNTFLDCLEYEWLRLAREKQVISLILIEIYAEENIKENIKKNMANIISEEIKRPTDLGASYHENQLVIMLPNTDNNGALHISNQVIKRLEETLQNSNDFQYKMSLVTDIPKPHESYSDLLILLESPLLNRKNQEIIYNQNLV